MARERGIGKITVIVLLAILVLTLLILFIYGMFFFPNKDFLKLFYWRWILFNSFSSIIDNLIPLTASAIIISFSVFIALRRIISPGEPFHAVISPALILFLVLTLLYTFLQEWVGPNLYTRTEGMRYLTERGRDFLSKADEAVNRRDFEEASVYLDDYLFIDPKNDEVREKLSSVQSRIRPVIEQEEEDPSGRPRHMILDQTPLDFLERAKKYYDERDYYSAHYYASLAYSLNDRLAEAQRLASRAWDRIGEAEASAKDEETSLLFRKKKAAYTALQDGRPLEAYYMFTELLSENPRDPDIRKYLALAEEETVKISFFLDEAAKVLTLAGNRNLVFINSFTETEREIIFIDKIVNLKDGTYARGIEAISFTPEGRVNYHLTAEYGKMINSSLVLQCLHRSNPEIRFLPVYHKGSRVKAEQYFLNINPKPRELSGFSASARALEQINLPNLWNIGKTLSQYGLRAERINQEILLRLLLPFTFLLSCVFSAALGWSLKIREDRPAFPAYAFMLVLPFVVRTVLELYIYGNRILLGFAVLTFGFTASLIIMIVLQALLLFAALFFLAGQTTE